MNEATGMLRIAGGPSGNSRKHGEGVLSGSNQTELSNPVNRRFNQYLRDNAQRLEQVHSSSRPGKAESTDVQLQQETQQSQTVDARKIDVVATDKRELRDATSVYDRKHESSERKEEREKPALTMRVESVDEPVVHSGSGVNDAVHAPGSQAQQSHLRFRRAGINILNQNIFNGAPVGGLLPDAAEQQRTGLKLAPPTAQKGHSADPLRASLDINFTIKRNETAGVEFKAQVSEEQSSTSSRTESKTQTNASSQTRSESHSTEASQSLSQSQSKKDETVFIERREIADELKNTAGETAPTPGDKEAVASAGDPRTGAPVPIMPDLKIANVPNEKEAAVVGCECGTDETGGESGEIRIENQNVMNVPAWQSTPPQTAAQATAGGYREGFADGFKLGFMMNGQSRVGQLLQEMNPLQSPMVKAEETMASSLTAMAGLNRGYSSNEHQYKKRSLGVSSPADLALQQIQQNQLAQGASGSGLPGSRPVQVTVTAGGNSATARSDAAQTAGSAVQDRGLAGEQFGFLMNALDLSSGSGDLFGLESLLSSLIERVLANYMAALKPATV